MPLVRFAVRNEYGLGVKELYKDGVQAEDPKAVLDGVAVAGLVGLLRQLGDLSQFAAEVFHDLQEQVASTASRSRKLVTRVQHVEASLPSLEKAILSQTSHIHFAYTHGSEWHPRIKNEQNHFVYDDLPQFVMDSYEECREPPRLQLLDRFDTGGPGSCLKRYSDPTFFRRASASSDVSKGEKSRRERKARKIKKRRSWKQSGPFSNCAAILNNSGRMQFSSPAGQGQSTESHAGSTLDSTLKSGLGDQPDSLGSKGGLDFVECVTHPSTSTQPNKERNKEVYSVVEEDMLNNTGPIYLNEQVATAAADISRVPAVETTVPCSSNVTWDEKLEIMEHMGLNNEIEDTQHAPETKFYLHEQELKPLTSKLINKVDDLPKYGSTVNSNCDGQETTADVKFMEPTGLFYLHEQEMKAVSAKGEQMDDLSEQGSSRESNADGDHPKASMDENFMEPILADYLHELEMKPVNSESCNDMDDFSDHGSSPRSNAVKHYSRTTIDGNSPQLTGLNCGTNGKFMESTIAHYLHELKMKPVNSVRCDEVDEFSDHGSSTRSNADKHYSRTTIDGDSQELTGLDCGANEGQDLLEENFDLHGHDLMVVSLESFAQAADLSKGEDSLELISDVNFMRDATDRNLGIGEVQNVHETPIDYAKQTVQTTNAEHMGDVDAFSEGENTLNAIEWHQHDDIDSETDNFVDALNTIDSETESDFESQTRKIGELSTSKHKPAENVGNDLMTDIISLPEPEPELGSHSTVLEHSEGVLDESEQPTASVSLADMKSLQNAQSSLNESEVATGQKQDVSLHLAHEQSVQSTQSSSLSNVFHGSDFCAYPDEKILQPPVSEIPASCSQPPPDDKSSWTPHVSQEMPVGSSRSYPVAFWTNGTLFGLQPSKPTVFSMPSSVNSDPTRSGTGLTVGKYSHTAVQKDGPAETLSSPVKDSDHGDKRDIDDQDVGSSKHMSDKTHEQPLDRDEGNVCGHSVMRGVSNGYAIPHESKVPVGADLKNVSSEGSNTSDDRSSLLSLLGRGLLKNGLRRSGSLGHDEKHKTSNPLTTNEVENGCNAAALHSVAESNLKGNVQSPVNSPPPSPPLEHMKISFQPIASLEVSKLKLKYPEGVDHHESTLDAFPSFQLVPESTKLQHDIASDSDDDTFCRSYACVSDDSLSHLSDSNSEQWESGDTSDSNDHALYDGLCRISSTESASSSPQREETDQGSMHVGSRSLRVAHSLADPTSRLQNCDTNDQFDYEEMKACLNPEADSTHLQELTPQPPPLPPLQWRVSRPLSDATEGKQDLVSNSLSQSFDSKLLHSTIAHPTLVDSDKPLSRTQEPDTIVETNKGDEARVDGRKQNYLEANERTGDDKEDFLQQIRTKSFNLKRTETARSFYTPSTATSNKVTAILQKANAIRKAVGSDGEDDSWSDT